MRLKGEQGLDSRLQLTIRELDIHAQIVEFRSRG
jgi:hypothetical protein